MTTATRAYINKKYNQFVDDECLEYRSIPMAIVDKLLKQKRPVSDFTGVKRVFNNVPARPINLNALATSIARMGNLHYSKVDAISSRIGMEEVKEVKDFVRNNTNPFLEPVSFASDSSTQTAPISTNSVSLGIQTKPKTFSIGTGPLGLSTSSKSIGTSKPKTFSIGTGSSISTSSFGTMTEREISTTGVPLRPRSKGISKRASAGIQGIVESSIGTAREVELLLGDESQTYNTPRAIYTPVDTPGVAVVGMPSNFRLTSSGYEAMYQSYKQSMSTGTKPSDIEMMRTALQAQKAEKFMEEKSGMKQATGERNFPALARTAISRQISEQGGGIYTTSRGGMRGGLKSIPDYPTEPILQNQHTAARMDSIVGQSYSKE